MVKFITIAGKRQVGKDTSAKLIKEILTDQDLWEPHEDVRGGCAGLYPKYSPLITHFADPLKKACNEIFGISLGDMETEVGKQKKTNIKWPSDTHDGWIPCIDPNNPAVGTNNETFGTPPAGSFMTVREVLQFVGTELFRSQMDPDIWVKSIFNKNHNPYSPIIVADCRYPNEADFAKQNGILIKVQRNTGLREDNHISEKALDDYNGFDYIIDNNGSFDDLREKLRVILKKEKYLTDEN